MANGKLSFLIALRRSVADWIITAGSIITGAMLASPSVNGELVLRMPSKELLVFAAVSATVIAVRKMNEVMRDD